MSEPLPLTIRERAAKGGKARAAALTAAQRSEAARTAVRARWAKRRQRLPKASTTTGHRGTVTNLTIRILCTGRNAIDA